MAEWLINYSKIHGRTFSKLTVIHGAGQTEFFQKIFAKISADVEIVTHQELKPEFLTKDKLRAEDGHAILVLGGLNIGIFCQYAVKLCVKFNR